MNHQRKLRMVAKTMLGLEEVLAEELIALGADGVQIGNRMVSFEGDLALMYKANFCCRTALRILRTVYEFKAKTTDDIYKKIKAMNWFEHLDESSTIAVDVVAFSDYFTHSKFVAYRVKDAIVDYFVSKTGNRVSVDVKDPDLRINLHIANDVCTLSFDSSGESLHKRGYRKQQTEAPLNEVLAAGMILKSGWRGETDFVDPMCGSGTFLIEAALIALNTPPGIYRKSYGFEKWKNFDKELFEHIYNDDSQERAFNHKIYGSDILPEAIRIAKDNIEEAGLETHIQVEVKAMEDYEKVPAEDGLLMTNPPYGERLQPEDLYGLYEKLGERLKHVFIGYKAVVLSYDKKCFHAIGLKHSNRYRLVNGKLECEVRTYEIFKGKRKEQIETN